MKRKSNRIAGIAATFVTLLAFILEIRWFQILAMLVFGLCAFIILSPVRQPPSPIILPDEFARKPKRRRFRYIAYAGIVISVITFLLPIRFGRYSVLSCIYLRQRDALPWQIKANNECTFGERQCVDNKTQICGQFDRDPSMEWSASVRCSSDEICEAGYCVPADSRPSEHGDSTGQ